MSFIDTLRSAVKEKDEDSRSIPFFCKFTIMVMVIGIAARLILGVFMTHIFDMHHWGLVIQNINTGNGLYEITGYFYTPLWGYVLGIEAFFQDLMGVTMIGEHLTEVFPLEGYTWYYIPTVTTIAFNLSVKLIFIVSDLVVGYLIFWLLRDITKDKRKAMIGFALWFLCPFVIGSGMAIGMFDTICVLMTLLSVIMLRKERYLESGVMLCMATLMKFFPGFFIFIFIAYIMSKSRNEETRKNLMLFLIGIGAAALVLFLPQLLDGTIADSFLFITSRLSDGVGLDAIGAVAGYVALFAYILALLVSIIFALRIKRNDDGERSDRLLFDALLMVTAVMFLYPALPQYILFLLPLVLFAMAYDKRYILSCCLLMVGTSIYVLAGGPTDMVAIAAYTDILSLDSLMGVIEAYIGPLFGISILHLIAFTGAAIQYIGIVSILWIRFGERIKGLLKKNTDKETASDQ